MPAPKPSWDGLRELAGSQAGHFLASQVSEHRFSAALLSKHVRSGRLLHVRRGLYRLAHYPPDEQEDLVVPWLWTERQTVYSHHTALGLHGLSDLLPTRLHLTAPASWQKRRLRLPPGVELHHADVSPAERVWAGVVPMTSALRTLKDCIEANLPIETMANALDQALKRGLVSTDELSRLGIQLREGR